MQTGNNDENGLPNDHLEPEKLGLRRTGEAERRKAKWYEKNTSA